MEYKEVEYTASLCRVLNF